MPQDISVTPGTAGQVVDYPPTNDTGISGTVPGNPPPPAPPQAPPPQQPNLSQPLAAPAAPAAPSPDQMQAHHEGLLGKAVKALMGGQVNYKVGPDGQMQTKEAPQKPGQLFRNILAGAILGGAVGGQTPDNGLTGGLRGAAAAQGQRQQMDDVNRERADQNYKRSLEASEEQRRQNKEQRDQAGFQTEQDLRRAQIAASNQQTMALSQEAATRGLEYQAKVGEMGRINAQQYVDAGIQPVGGKGDIPYSQMGDFIKDHPGVSANDAIVTGVHIIHNPDGSIGTEPTVTFYDPKADVTVTPAVLAQWKKDGVDPQVFSLIKPNAQISVQQYNTLKRLDEAAAQKQFSRQKDDLEIQKTKLEMQNVRSEMAHRAAEELRADKADREANKLGDVFSELESHGGDMSKLADDKDTKTGLTAGGKRLLIAKGIQSYLMPAAQKTLQESIQQDKDRGDGASSPETIQAAKEVQNYQNLMKDALIGTRSAASPAAGGGAPASPQSQAKVQTVLQNMQRVNKVQPGTEDAYRYIQQVPGLSPQEKVAAAKAAKAIVPWDEVVQASAKANMTPEQYGQALQAQGLQVGAAGPATDNSASNFSNK